MLFPTLLLLPNHNVLRGTTGFELRSSTKTISGVSVLPTPLRVGDPASPYAFAVSSIQALPSHVNFLATQIWPSARMAAVALEEYTGVAVVGDKARMPSLLDLTICEFGCGPGLPSLAAARKGACRVIATDLDPFALQLVQQAAEEQGLSQQQLETRCFDLVDSYVDEIPFADLYVLSDVFENGAVAEGAARITAEILERGTATVWVFAQSDRSQREVYLKELQHLLGDPKLCWKCSARDDDSIALQQQEVLQWNGRLWLSDVDERFVAYG